MIPIAKMQERPRSGNHRSRRAYPFLVGTHPGCSGPKRIGSRSHKTGESGGHKRSFGGELRCDANKEAPAKVVDSTGAPNQRGDRRVRSPQGNHSRVPRNIENHTKEAS
jgi:hypothetical protein